MDSYLKQLLGDSTLPLINIVDDNVHPSLDRSNGLAVQQPQRRSRPALERSTSMIEQRRQRSKHQSKQKPRIASWSHPDGQSKWASIAGEKPVHPKLQRRSSDSVLGKPRRRSSESEIVDSDVNTNARDAMGSTHRLLSSVLHRSIATTKTASTDINSNDDGESSLAKDTTGGLEAKRVCNGDLNGRSNHSDPGISPGKESLGKPYIVSLKPATSPVENKNKDLSGPPEKPERRGSDESITLVAALEAAVAASPMSSGENSLVHQTHRRQETKEKEINETLLRTHLTTRLASASLLTSKNRELPPSFRELPYDSESNCS